MDGALVLSLLLVFVAAPPVLAVQQPGRTPLALVFSPDDRYVLTDELVYELASGRQVGRGGRTVWDQTGKRAVSGSRIQSFPQLERTFSIDDKAGDPLGFTPDEKTIITAWGTVDPRTGAFTPHGGRRWNVAMSPDRKLLIYDERSYDAQKKGFYVVVDVTTGKERARYKVGINDKIHALMNDGRAVGMIWSEKEPRQIVIWSARGVELITEYSPFPIALAIDDKATRIAMIPLGGKTLDVFDLKTKTRRTIFEDPQNKLGDAVAFSHDGKLLAAGKGTTVALFDLKSGKLTRTLGAESHVEMHMGAFTADQQYLVTWLSDHAAKKHMTFTFRVADGRPVASEAVRRPGDLLGCGVRIDDQVHALEGRITARANLLCTKTLEISFRDSTLAVSELPAGRERFRINLPEKVYVTAAAISADEKRFAIATSDYRPKESVHLLRFYDAITGVEDTAATRATQTYDLATSAAGALTWMRYDSVEEVDFKTGKTLRVVHAKLVVDSPVVGASRSVLTPDGKRVVVRHSMPPVESVSVYDVAAKVLRARVFFMIDRSGGPVEWGVLAEDGRYDGTPGAIARLHWVQNGRAIPLESFAEKYYTPRLLPALLEGDRAVLPDLQKGFAPPPAVTITAAATETDQEEIEVVVVAKDMGGGVSDVTLMHNGKSVETATRGMKKKGDERRFMISLLPGDNVLRATAFSNERVESPPAEITVVRKAAAASSRLFALIIGVDAYSNPKYALGFAKKDATAFADRLKSGASRIFKSVEVSELYDTQVTRASIEAALVAIAAKASAPDMLVVYFAGHGVMGSDVPEFFLIPHDVERLYGDDAGLAAKALPAKRLAELVRKVPANKQVILLDACESGGSVDAFAFRGAAEEKAIYQLSRSAGVAVLSASSAGEFANEVKALGHGVFTYAVLEALAGAADGSPKDGKITVKELEAYVSDQVPELSKKYRGSRQIPNTMSPRMDFPLAAP